MTQSFELLKAPSAAVACGRSEGGMLELSAEKMEAVSGAGFGDFLRRVGAAVRESMKYVRHNNGLVSEFEA